MYSPGIQLVFISKSLGSTGSQFDDVYFDGAMNVKLTGPANVFDVTGVSALGDGDVITISNRTGYTVTLKDQDTDSLSANRFAFGADYNLAHGTTIQLWYDGIIDRWYKLNG